MNCRELAELLLDYVQGELEPDVCSHIQRHLSQCSPCVTYLETYRITIQLSRRLPAAPMPPELIERLRAALQEIEQSGEEVTRGHEDRETPKHGK
jgi:anti-sigma factor RsiW